MASGENMGYDTLFSDTAGATLDSKSRGWHQRQSCRHRAKSWDQVGSSVTLQEKLDTGDPEVARI